MAIYGEDELAALVRDLWNYIENAAESETRFADFEALHKRVMESGVFIAPLDKES